MAENRVEQTTDDTNLSLAQMAISFGDSPMLSLKDQALAWGESDTDDAQVQQALYEAQRDIDAVMMEARRQVESFSEVLLY